MCLSLYYACTKFRHYLLSSTCIVVCQTDVFKRMLQKPILNDRIGEWAYAVVEYDLAFESLKSIEAKLYWISLLSIGLMISMICKSAMLLAHHGNYISID